MELDEFKQDIKEALAKLKPIWFRDGQFVFNYIESNYGVARNVQYKHHVDCFYNDDAIDRFIFLAWCEITGVEPENNTSPDNKEAKCDDVKVSEDSDFITVTIKFTNKYQMVTTTRLVLNKKYISCVEEVTDKANNNRLGYTNIIMNNSLSYKVQESFDEIMKKINNK